MTKENPGAQDEMVNIKAQSPPQESKKKLEPL
jgi:hypothetical protein